MSQFQSFYVEGADLKPDSPNCLTLQRVSCIIPYCATRSCRVGVAEEAESRARRLRLFLSRKVTMATEVAPGDNLHSGARSVGLPPRPFLYTLDQIATILDIKQSSLEMHYIFWDQRSVGPVNKSQMMARNIAPSDHRPDWRVAERELVRWMKRKGFRFYERSSVRG